MSLNDAFVGEKVMIINPSRTFSWRESENDLRTHYTKEVEGEIKSYYKVSVHNYRKALHQVSKEDNDFIIEAPIQTENILSDMKYGTGVVEYIDGGRILGKNILTPNIIIRQDIDKDVLFATRLEDLIFLSPIAGVNCIYSRDYTGTNNRVIEYNFLQSDGYSENYGRLCFEEDGHNIEGMHRCWDELSNLGDYLYSSRIEQVSALATDTYIAVNKWTTNRLCYQYKDFSEIPTNTLKYIINCYKDFHRKIVEYNKVCYHCSSYTDQHHYTQFNYFKDHYICGQCAYQVEGSCSFCNSLNYLKDFTADILNSNNLLYLKEKLFGIGADNVCYDCLVNLFVQCSNCREIELVDLNNAINSSEMKVRHLYGLLLSNKERYNDQPFCSSCYNERIHDSINQPCNGIGSIKDTFPYTRKSNNISRYVSVESEVITYYDEYDDEDGECNAIEQVWSPENWRPVYDGSLNQGGVEFKNISPVRGDYIETGLVKLENAAVDQEFWVDTSCGIHVHMDARDFNWRELRSLLLIMNSIEPSIIKSLPEDRRNSRYALPIDKVVGMPLENKYIYESINNLKELVSFSYETLSDTNPGDNRYNQSRYRGTNIHSRFFHGTIEFRYHEGALDPTGIMNWINLCNKIMVAASCLERDTSKWKRIKNMLLNKEHGLDVIKSIGGKSSLDYIEDKIKRYGDGIDTY